MSRSVLWPSAREHGRVAVVATARAALAAARRGPASPPEPCVGAQRYAGSESPKPVTPAAWRVKSVDRRRTIRAAWSAVMEVGLRRTLGRLGRIAPQNVSHLLGPRQRSFYCKPRILLAVRGSTLTDHLMCEPSGRPFDTEMKMDKLQRCSKYVLSYVLQVIPAIIVRDFRQAATASLLSLVLSDPGGCFRDLSSMRRS
jgi:hypothetical protein